MHPIDIDNTLKTMVIFTDSNEQKTDRARHRYAQFKCPHQRKKLNFGDYSCQITLPNGTIHSFEEEFSVERKMDWGELCNCFTWERGRFEREFERAKAKNAKIYLLVENATLDDAYSGNYRSQTTPASFTASIFAWLARYNCQIILCSEKISGRVIRDILYREAKERLERGDFDDNKNDSPVSSQPVP